MNKKNLIKTLPTIVMSINLILMIITIIFQVISFNPLRYTILSFFILLLITISLVFDGFLKDFKSLYFHSICYFLWVFSAIINLLYI